MYLPRVAVATLLLGTAAVAGAITLDGDLSDWGVTIPNTADAPLIDWVPTGVLSGVGYSIDDGQIGPGGGGQDFDTEAMYAYLDTESSRLYIAMVTGFDPYGQWGSNGTSNQWFDVGDIFIDVGGGSAATATWDYAVRIDPNPSDKPNTNIGQNDTWSTGSADVFTSWTSLEAVTTSFHESEPYRVDSGTAGGQANVFWRDAVNDPGTSTNRDLDHNVVELSFGLLDEVALAIQEDGLWIHWTMGCGNDPIDLRIVGSGPSTPETPVPEPATLSLMGIGLAIAAIRRKLS